MNSQDIKKLIEGGRVKEAQVKLQEYLKDVKLSQAEMGEVYAELASLYLKINNQLLDFYNSFLEKALIDVKSLNSREKELI